MAKNKSQTNTTSTSQRQYTPQQTTFQNNLDNINSSFLNQFNTSAANSRNDYNSIMNTYRGIGNQPVYGAGRTGFGGGVNPVTGTARDTGIAGRIINPATGQPISGGTTSGGNYNPSGSTDPNSRDYVRGQIAQSMMNAGLTPSETRGTGANDLEYYTDEAMKNGAGSEGNMGYWANRISNDAMGGGGGGWGNFFGSAPSFPGFNSAAYSYFQDFANGGGSVGFDPEAQGAISDALKSYRNFVDTGGFSPQDIQDLRARAISPTRAVYANAQQNLNRNRALQGYSPNYAAATAKMARDLGQSVSDANVNANASIAQAIQQGKEFGTSGLSSTGLSEGQIKAAIDQFNQSMKMSGAQGMSGLDQFRAQLQEAYDQLGFQYANMNAQTGLGYDQLAASTALGAAAGERELYGTTPGETSMYGSILSNLLGVENSSLNNPAGGVTTTGQQTEPMTGLDYLRMAGTGVGVGTQAYDAYNKMRGGGDSINPNDYYSENARLSAPPESGIGTGAEAGVGSALTPTLSTTGAGTTGLTASQAASLPGYTAIPSAEAVAGPIGEGTGVGIAGGGGGVASGAPLAAESASTAAGGSATGTAGSAAGMSGGELAGTLAGSVGIPLALMFAINKWTGGPSQYNKSGFMGNYTPFGSVSGVQDPETRARVENTYQQMVDQYGPDDPQVIQFRMLNGL